MDPRIAVCLGVHFHYTTTQEESRRVGLVINGINTGVLIHSLALCLRYTQGFLDIHSLTCCRKDEDKSRDGSPAARTPLK